MHSATRKAPFPRRVLQPVFHSNLRDGIGLLLLESLVIRLFCAPEIAGIGNRIELSGLSDAFQYGTAQASRKFDIESDLQGPWHGDPAAEILAVRNANR